MPRRALGPGDIEGDSLPGEGCRAVPLKFHRVRRALEPHQNACEIQFAAGSVDLQHRLVGLHPARTRRKVFERLAERLHTAGYGERASTLVDDDAPDLKAV